MINTQRLQIELIKVSREVSKEELGKTDDRPCLIELENKDLKKKIEELQATIEEYEKKNRELVIN